MVNLIPGKSATLFASRSRMCVTFEYHVFRWIERGNERVHPRFLNPPSRGGPSLPAFHAEEGATDVDVQMLVLPPLYAHDSMIPGIWGSNAICEVKSFEGVS